MTTIYDVAKKANVSAMTVSRVINNASSIKEETRQRVLKAIKELDYIPNRTAQSLSSKDSKLLSLIITDITNPFFTRIARGAEDRANESGYQVVFSNSDETISKESAYIRSVISRGIDGVLLVPASEQSKDNVAQLSKHQIPYVLIDREIHGVSSDIIMGDNQKSTKHLLEHLVNLGHRNIALVTGPPHISNIREREVAYDEIIEKYSMPEPLIFRADLTRNQSASFIDLFLQLPKERKPTAIFAVNNFLAVNLINGFRSQGIIVPDELSIVCFDDPHPVPDVNPFLTFINQPAYQFGYRGMEILINKIEKKEKNNTPQKIIIPSDLIIGKSTKAI